MLSIIIPTYNEKETILRTISEIKKNIKGIKHEILVIDDNSPDKTWNLINNSKISNTICIRRLNKKGLSSAIIDGFQKAKYEKILVMDADGQHEPKIIKQMLKQINNYDFVIGSRYIKGGSVENWPKKRIIISKTASFLAQTILSSKIKDPMSGFFMTKKEKLNEIKSQVSGIGYKILLDMLLTYQNLNKKYTIKEVPYKFRIRDKGKSKLNSKVTKDYLRMLISFKLKKHSQVMKFLIVGSIGIILNTILLWFFTEKIGLYYIFSGIISTETAIISNFLLNDLWTWGKRNKKNTFVKRLLLFNLVSIVGLIITVSTLGILTELGLYYLLSNIIGIILATSWNYLANDKITFKI
jgi:dolichol-phosphate mannosyltransferase